jgi:trehalose-6-phosphate synthase
VASPSRERVEQYQVLRDDVELRIGRINGNHGPIGTPAVHYLHHSYPREETPPLLGEACAGRRSASLGRPAVGTPSRPGTWPWHGC